MAAPWEVLPVGLAVPTIVVREDVNGKLPRRYLRRVRQRPPSLLKETSMVGPLRGAAGGPSSAHHRC
jgi:hypothetical protein